MASRRLMWQLVPSFLAITLVALVAVTLYASYLVEAFANEALSRELEAHARLAARQLPKHFDPVDRAASQELCRQITDTTGLRITVILPNGEVFSDTAEDPAHMENHLNRPEVARALQGIASGQTRPSPTTGEVMTYYAIPIEKDGQALAVARASVSTAAATAARRQLQWRTALATLGVLACAGALACYVVKKISAPLEELRRGAERFAQGDLNYKLGETHNWEFDRLAASLNTMAAQLEDRLTRLETTNGEHEAILASMSEGVLAVAVDRTVFSLNTAAAKLLGSERSRIQGRTLHEVVRHPRLRNFIERALQSRAPLEEDLELGDDAHERVLQARGALLRDARGGSHGVVIVLKDVSRMRQLETMRTDFAANVSHELKTPITSIKGFVETLLDGAMQDPDDCRRFLQIVAKQSDRLNAIIDDLMSLARIEQNASSSEIALESSAVKPVLEAAVEECLVKAREKEIKLEVQCLADVRAELNAALLEQAVANLIDNAVKYSGQGSQIEIRAARSEREVTISVSDHGCGIPAEHIPRLFERFYRVDKARSRKVGGTGLGLAIVKHIVYAHRARITVDSKPGEGSTFTIHLPLPMHRPALDSTAA